MDESGQQRWLVSYDNVSHCFTELGEVVSESLCGNSARTNRLLTDMGSSTKCLGCLVALGESLPADARWH